MAAYRHLLPPMPPTTRVYGAPNDHLHAANSRAYDDLASVGQSSNSHSTPSGMMNNGHQSVPVSGSAPPAHQAQHHNMQPQQQPPTSQHQQQQQQAQFYHHQQQQGMHLHNHHHTANHHPLSYQQFSVVGGQQHMNLARHLLATGQAAAAHQQAMHNNNAMKGMIYHGGMRSSVVPLNASKCREESAWWFFKDSFLETGEYL